MYKTDTKNEGKRLSAVTFAIARAITKWEAAEQSRTPKVILYFRGINNIFADCNKSTQGCQHTNLIHNLEKIAMLSAKIILVHY